MWGSCFMSYFYSIVSFLVADQSPRLGKKEQFLLLSFTCNYVVSVRMGFFFLLVLEMGCLILLCHSMGLPYKYYIIEHID